MRRRGDCCYDHAGGDSTPARRGDHYHAGDDLSLASSYCYYNNPDFGFHGCPTRLLDHPQGLNHPVYQDKFGFSP